MQNIRYPDYLTITPADFAGCGWQGALSGTEYEGYAGMWQALSRVAREDIELGRDAHGKVLWLLADVCSMRLVPSSANEPFKPFAAMDGRRSFTPDDLNEADIVFLSDIADQIADARLSARVNDLIWLLRRQLGPKFALAAIDAYRSIPLDMETWLHGGRQCWERAISLAFSLGEGAGERLEQIESSLFSSFESATKTNGFWALWLSELLFSYRLSRASWPDIANRLEHMGKDFSNAGDIHCARQYFDYAARFFRASNLTAKSAEMIAAHAEEWANEAIAQSSSEHPSYLLAANFYEKAIQIYRTIPRSDRAAHNVDFRMVELHKLMSDAGERSLGEMSPISIPNIDISEIVKNARNAVKGKDALEALRTFACIYPGPRLSQLRSSSEQILNSSISSLLFSSSFLSRDGRVIAKRPASNDSNNYETSLQAQMVEDYQLSLKIVVIGSILPALDMLLLEHRLTEQDFIELARQSPLVPLGREQLMGKALYAGYDKDFPEAIHILVPQLEHIVRFHLKNVHIKTTTLDKDGIETENGLSTLVDLPETISIFGEDIAFELRALFCHPFGPNLRNELAHGLLDDGACQSAPAIYAWWFGLKLVFAPYWNALRKAGAVEDPTGSTGGADERNASTTAPDGTRDPGED